MVVNLNACQRRGQKGFEGKRPIGMLIGSIFCVVILGLFLTLGCTHNCDVGRELPSGSHIAFGKEVSGREKLSAQGFQRNHRLLWIKVQKENLG